MSYHLSESNVIKHPQHSDAYYIVVWSINAEHTKVCRRVRAARNSCRQCFSHPLLRNICTCLTSAKYGKIILKIFLKNGQHFYVRSVHLTSGCGLTAEWPEPTLPLELVAAGRKGEVMLCQAKRISRDTKQNTFLLQSEREEEPAPQGAQTFRRHGQHR